MIQNRSKMGPQGGLGALGRSLGLLRPLGGLLGAVLGGSGVRLGPQVEAEEAPQMEQNTVQKSVEF